jgi:hypothetical protein
MGVANATWSGSSDLPNGPPPPPPVPPGLQAPLLASSSPDLSNLLMSSLKHGVFSGLYCINVVMTGSGLMSALAQISLLPTNGHHMWSLLGVVQLGTAPSRSAGAAMAAEISPHLLGTGKQAVMDAALSIIDDNPDLLTFRPAVIVEAIGAVAAGNDLGDATKQLRNKVMLEALPDLANALDMMLLQPDGMAVNRALFRIAAHHRLPEDLRDRAAAFKFIAALTSPSDTSHGIVDPRHVPGSLLPPYPALIQLVVDEDGNLRRPSCRRTALPDYVAAWLKFVVEERASPACTVTAEQWHQVDLAVTHALARSGIGLVPTGQAGLPTGASWRGERLPVASVADFARVPALKKLALGHQRGVNPESWDDAIRRLVSAGDPPGLAALRIIRNVAAHVNHELAALGHVGISLFQIVAAVEAARDAMLALTNTAGGPMYVAGASGVPQRTDAKPSTGKEELLRQRRPHGPRLPSRAAGKR